MPSFRQHREGNAIVIHASSLSLPADIDFLQAAPEPAGIPSTRSVRIFSDTLTITGTVYNSGADVRITCRVLKLEQGATIDTSGPRQQGPSAPPHAPADAGSNGRPGTRGLQGFHSGDVSILCSTVVRVGQFPDGHEQEDGEGDEDGEGGVWVSEALTARPALMEDGIDADIGTFVVGKTDRAGKKSAKKRSPPCWLNVRAVGGEGGEGQDGQAGGDGRPGVEAVKINNTIKKHDLKKTGANVKKVEDSLRKKYKGAAGRPGGAGGKSGAGGRGGNGGAFRFAATHGTFSAGDTTTPEADWVPAVCTYAHRVGGGPAGTPGLGGQGAVGGRGGSGAEFKVTVEFKKKLRIKIKYDKETIIGQGKGGDGGKSGADAGRGGSGLASSSRGTAGSGPRSGASFDEEELVSMLDVDHLLSLERVAGKAWLNGTHSGDQLIRQVNTVKFFAEFLLEHTDDNGSSDSQLWGIVASCELARQRVASGANYFGFMPGFTPRTTTETIMHRIDTILPLAKTTQQQLETFEDKVSSSDDRKEALSSAIRLATADLADKMATVAELDDDLDNQLSLLRDQQQEIVRRWQGDPADGVKGLMIIHEEFVTSLRRWTPPSTGPDWLNIGLIVAGAVLAVAITVATAGTAAPAAGAILGSALAKEAARKYGAEVATAVVENGISAAIAINGEIDNNNTQQEPALETLPIPITQDMNDTMRQLLIESIDRAAESTGGDIDDFAVALKDAYRKWIDLCQERNASIVEYQETLVAHQQATAQVKRLAAQLTRVKEQVAKNNIDPNIPVLAEFMESSLEEQKFFLLRELFREYAKLVGIDALSTEDAFVVSSGSTVADLSSMHARYLIKYSLFQDDVVQLSVAFKTTIDLTEDVVQELATDQLAEFRFTNLPASLDMLTDIMVNTVALRVGKEALTGSGHVTAGIYCQQDERAGLSCYDVGNSSDDFVATLAGQGNAGARLEGTDWTINLGYATNATSIEFGKLQSPDGGGGVQLIVSGVGKGPAVRLDIAAREEIIEDEEEDDDSQDEA